MEPANILIVEDEIIVAMELEEKLRSLGYRVAGIVSSGEAAIRRVDETKPDLVLMDIRLQGDMDGIDAAKAIHSVSDVPVVFLTAYADEATVQRAKPVLPMGYLIKPFSEAELRTTIEISLYKHSAEAANKDVTSGFAASVKLLGAGLVMTDANGFITYMNAAGEALTGWSGREAVGLHFTEVLRLKELTTGEILDNPIKKPLTAGGVTGQFQNMLVTGADTEVYVTTNVSPITDEMGDFKGVILAFQESSKDIQQSSDWYDLAANLYLSASLCASDGEYAKAESFYSRALLLFERNLGSDHPRVANVLSDLASLRKKMELHPGEDDPAG